MADRNAPCPCGSGKKYKKCCGAPGAVRAAPTAPPSNIAELLARGEAAEADGRLPEAESAYRSLLDRHPDHARARLRLGRVMIARCGAPRLTPLSEPGVAQIRDAAARAPRDFEVVFGLGNALYELQEYDEALEVARRAGSLGGDRAGAQVLVAGCLERLNRVDEARVAVQRALDRVPDHAYALIVGARLDRRGGNLDAADRALARVLERDDVQTGWRIIAMYERAQVLDRLGRYDEAYQAFATAGRVSGELPEARVVDRELFPQNIARYRAGTTPDLLARARDETFDDGRPPPAFLVGFARSGTTMMEQVVAAHPDARTSDEVDLLHAVRLGLGTTVSGEPDPPARLRLLDRARIERLRAAYWQAVDEHDPSVGHDKVFLDKSPMNIIDLPLINVVFPDARVIVALRDPRDVCLSCFMQHFGLNPGMIHFLTLAGAVKLYAQVMDLWLHIRPMLTLDFVEVRYEDTVGDLEPHARQIIAHLGLAWTDEILDFHQRARERKITTPSYEAVAKPVHTGAVGRWRNYATYFEPHQETLARFVEAFGYE